MNSRQRLASLWYRELHEALLHFPFLSLTSGKRSDARNASVGGRPGSKHTAAGGDGLAADLVTDTPEQRDPVVAWLEGRGWHVVIEEGYAPNQLHAQAYPYGVQPSEEAAARILSSLGVVSESPRPATPPIAGANRNALGVGILAAAAPYLAELVGESGALALSSDPRTAIAVGGAVWVWTLLQKGYKTILEPRLRR